MSCGLLTLSFAANALAADHDYVGVLSGLSTLSADGRSEISASGTAVSLYKPENGPTLSVFVGRVLSNYLALQANYGWNRNSLTLASVGYAAGRETAYEESRGSAQQSVWGDLLVYFRNRRSVVRPYLSVGTGVVYLSSSRVAVNHALNSPEMSPARFSFTGATLHVAVGIDVFHARGWSLRYSFSEAAQGNPISAQLNPPGQRGLKNFQNFFGLIRSF